MSNQRADVAEANRDRQERRGAQDAVRKDALCLTDDTGREYTTLKEPIARRTWTRSDEVAWRTAIDAAPYILSDDALEKEVPPEEFFEKLNP